MLAISMRVRQTQCHCVSVVGDRGVEASQVWTSCSPMNGPPGTGRQISSTRELSLSSSSSPAASSSPSASPSPAAPSNAAAPLEPPASPSASPLAVASSASKPAANCKLNSYAALTSPAMQEHAIWTHGQRDGQLEGMCTEC